MTAPNGRQKNYAKATASRARPAAGKRGPVPRYPYPTLNGTTSTIHGTNIGRGYRLLSTVLRFVRLRLARH
jgi:hypothetical protein